jgi:hypothetical protein
MLRLRYLFFLVGLLAVVPALTGCIDYGRHGYGTGHWHYAHGRGHGRW